MIRGWAGGGLVIVEGSTLATPGQPLTQLLSKFGFP